MIADRMTKRMIDLQKSTFDMMLNTMSSIQEQSGRATQVWFEQMARLPQESVKSMGNWMDSMRDTRNEFNSAIREGFENWGSVVEQTIQQTDKVARPRQPAAKPRKQVPPPDQDTAFENRRPPSEDDLEKLKAQLEERNP